MFIDDYSRYCYVYLIRRKSKAFERFKEFRVEAEKQLGKHIEAPFNLIEVVDTSSGTS
jgi:hypothetical protein